MTRQPVPLGSPISMRGVARGIGALLTAGIGLFAAYLVSNYFALHLLLNDTTRHLSQYREITRRDGDVNLMPGLFQGGELKQSVEAQLLGAGLDAWGKKYAQMPPGAADMQRFRLWAGARDIACGSELFLTIGYDREDRLISATVEQGGACL